MIKTTPNTRRLTFAVLVIVLLALAGSKSGAKEPKGSGQWTVDSGQESPKPVLPSDQIVAWMINPPIPRHPTPDTRHLTFWDAQNTALIVAGAGLRAGDVYTTRRFLALGGRERIMPSRLVSNTPAFAAYSGAAAASVAGLAYLAHRTRHHRIERVTLWLHAGFMAGLVVNNTLTIRRLQNR